MELIGLFLAPYYFWFNYFAVWTAVDNILLVTALLQCALCWFSARCFPNSVLFLSYMFLSNTSWYFLQKEPLFPNAKWAVIKIHWLQQLIDQIFTPITCLSSCRTEMCIGKWSCTCEEEEMARLIGRKETEFLFSGNYTLTSCDWNISIDFIAFLLQICQILDLSSEVHSQNSRSYKRD